MPFVSKRFSERSRRWIETKHFFIPYVFSFPVYHFAANGPPERLCTGSQSCYWLQPLFRFSKNNGAAAFPLKGERPLFPSTVASPLPSCHKLSFFNRRSS
jgi:hypothetical protein